MTAMMTTQFGIDRGLLLEDRGVLLPWNTTPDELGRIERPQFATLCGPHGRRWYWRGGRCFSGFAAACVSTEFDSPAWPQPRLSGLRITCSPAAGPIVPTEAFQVRQWELGQRFGPPTSIERDGFRGEAVWRFEKVSLRHEYWDGFGGDHSLYIFVTPEPQPRRRPLGE
jgi:hypothetical protein